MAKFAEKLTTNALLELIELKRSPPPTVPTSEQPTAPDKDSLLITRPSQRTIALTAAVAPKFILPFSAQKSRVKPHIGLTH